MFRKSGGEDGVVEYGNGREGGRALLPATGEFDFDEFGQDSGTAEYHNNLPPGSGRKRRRRRLQLVLGFITIAMIVSAAIVLTGGLAAIPVAATAAAGLGIALGTAAGNVTAIFLLTVGLALTEAVTFYTAKLALKLADNALWYGIYGALRLNEARKDAYDAKSKNYLAEEANLYHMAWRRRLAIGATVVLATAALSTLIVLTGGLAAIPMAATAAAGLGIALGTAAGSAAMIGVMTLATVTLEAIAYSAAVALGFVFEAIANRQQRKQQNRIYYSSNASAVADGFGINGSGVTYVFDGEPNLGAGPAQGGGAMPGSGNYLHSGLAFPGIVPGVVVDAQRPGLRFDGGQWLENNRFDAYGSRQPAEQILRGTADAGSDSEGVEEVYGKGYNRIIVGGAADNMDDNDDDEYLSKEAIARFKASGRRTPPDTGFGGTSHSAFAAPAAVPGSTRPRAPSHTSSSGSSGNGSGHSSDNDNDSRHNSRGSLKK